MELARAPLSAERLKEAKRRVDALFAKHRRWQAIFNDLCLVVELGRSTDEMPCFLVTGPYGVGKTTLKKQLAKRFPAVPDSCEVFLPRDPAPLRTASVPLLALEMPGKPTRRKLLIRILQGYHDPDALRRDDETLLDARVRAFIEASGTVVVVIDEAQRAIDRAGVVVSEDVAELLKELHGALHVSFALLGLGRVKYLFEQDGQLDERWDKERRLDPFAWYERVQTPDGEKLIDNHKDQGEFVSILKLVQDRCEVPFAIDLTSPDTAYRFFYATQGVLRRLKRLFRRAIFIMLGEGDRATISMDLLARAFDELFRADMKRMQNPFRDDFHRELPPAVDNDYELRPSAEQRRRNKAAALRSSAPGV